MNIGIDIDGTIAGRNMQAFALACSQQFGFQLESEQISYVSLMNHPMMIVQQASDQFEQAIACIEQAPAMLLAAPSMKGAVEGVQKLAHYGDLGYYTVRKGYPPYSSEDVENATRSWLCERQFPASDQVTFCMSLANKLMQIYRKLRMVPERFVLIDDMAPTLLECYKQLQSGHHPVLSAQQCQQVTALLQQHVILVAFGASNFAINSDLPVYHLQTWEGVDDLIQFCLSMKGVSNDDSNYSIAGIRHP